MRYWIIPTAFVLLTLHNALSSNITAELQPQSAKTTIVQTSAGSIAESSSNIPKDKGLDQETASSDRKSRQSSYHSQSNQKPQKYSYSYDSGPQYYESTPKPVRYYREYNSPPSSYSSSYNTGPQGYSYQSPPQQSSHSSSYNHQDGNKYGDGSSSGGGNDYGGNNYENNDSNEYENDHGNDGDSIEY